MSSLTNHKIRPMVVALEDMGVTVVEAHYNKHWKVVVQLPQGTRHVLTIAGSPSDHRTMKNIRGDVRRLLRQAENPS